MLFIFSVASAESTSDENVGSQRGINDPQPFRVNKLNMMWDKAKQVSGSFTSDLSPYGTPEQDYICYV